jgi:hypothetical protein
VVRDDIFPVLWQFLKIAASPACGTSRTIQAGESLAAAGGKKCSNYFQNRAPARNCQICLARFGRLGNQIVGNFRRKNQSAVLFAAKPQVKENFFNNY